MVTALAMVLETVAQDLETAAEMAKGIAVFLLKLHRLPYFLPGVEMAMVVMAPETVLETAEQDLETAVEMALVLAIVPTPDTPNLRNLQCEVARRDGLAFLCPLSRVVVTN